MQLIITFETDKDRSSAIKALGRLEVNQNMGSFGIQKIDPPMVAISVVRHTDIDGEDTGIDLINAEIDRARLVYLWIANSNLPENGKYIETPKTWVKQLIADEFSGDVQYSYDDKTDELYFH